MDQALRFLLDVAFGLMTYAFLLRFMMQWLRAPFRNPAGQALPFAAPVRSCQVIDDPNQLTSSKTAIAIRRPWHSSLRPGPFGRPAGESSPS